MGGGLFFSISFPYERFLLILYSLSRVLLANLCTNTVENNINKTKIRIYF